MGNACNATCLRSKLCVSDTSPCQTHNKKTTYLSGKPFGRGDAIRLTASGLKILNHSQLEPIACNATCLRSKLCVSDASPCQKRNKKTTYLLGKPFGRGDAIRLTASGLKILNYSQLYPIACNATCLRSKLCVSDTSPCQKRNKKTTYLYGKPFGRGDAIRTRNQWFWRPLLYR